MTNRIEVHVKNTNMDLVAAHTVTLAVQEIDRDPEKVTIGPRAERTFFVADTGDLKVTGGEEFASVSYPRGLPAPALVEASEPPPAATAGDPLAPLAPVDPAVPPTE